ncbi:NlpC/P60 family protein [Streptomyces sp. ME08-AFT2]|uniref:C40 family peptidase n=1 Tax=Streptomyces sp. ME08-AFT2 TaxID=3028683 RepID=UPI0029B1DE81|nr:NlpC/P60 family protein [Streptomyces sp. ME08-AFT2]MDX3307781.1 NlpC/P60 family protein [Streptomyces sp. ME08-AFT2]
MAGIRPPALATAALTSVALLSQSANAAPSDDGRPSLEEVEKKVDDLYRQAGSATEKSNSAKEKTPRTSKQRTRADGLLDDVAPQRTRNPSEAREEPGPRAAARYRTGASAPATATPLLADTQQDHAGRNRLTDRPTDRRQGAVDDYVAEQSATPMRRHETAESLATPADPQHGLRTAKAAVQKKLGDAREVLSRLTAQETARLAAIEKLKQEEAARAAELAHRQAAAQQAAAQQAAAQQTARPAEERIGGPSGTESTGTAGTAAPTAASAAYGAPPAAASAAYETSPTTPSAAGAAASAGSVVDASYAVKAEKALAFARAQIGKPYVWGATGPGSYDCSGLTQAAWKAAAVTLPRSTHAQAGAGVTVPLAAARPGDLIFFYDDVSHVGVCIGNGMMIHSPKPGAYVREESIYCDGESGIHSVVRPA